jgi:hypothetical protein
MTYVNMEQECGKLKDLMKSNNLACNSLK